MEYKKYVSRWGISLDGFKDIQSILDDDLCDHVDYNIVEFGSGLSTMFFLDYAIRRGLTGVKITSFENNAEFAAHIEHPQLNLQLRPLLTCSDEDYDNMFDRRIYMPQCMNWYMDKPKSRQKNCFYQIKDGDLPMRADFVLLDGPNGNGRNISYLFLKDIVFPGAYVFIDDFDHYDFVEKFGLFFDYDVVVKREADDSRKKRDRYVVLKVTKKRY
jgi:hypothetical protein